MIGRNKQINHLCERLIILSSILLINYPIALKAESNSVCRVYKDTRSHLLFQQREILSNKAFHWASENPIEAPAATNPLRRLSVIDEVEVLGTSLRP